ncbi:hypothetical protein V8C44DRAFT_333180 [Trichoderma aethiopicum]
MTASILGCSLSILIGAASGGRESTIAERNARRVLPMPLVKQRWQDAFPVVAKAGSRNNAQGAGSSLGNFSTNRGGSCGRCREGEAVSYLALSLPLLGISIPVWRAATMSQI